MAGARRFWRANLAMRGAADTVAFTRPIELVFACPEKFEYRKY
jgi:hypothetical protein